RATRCPLRPTAWAPFPRPPEFIDGSSELDPYTRTPIAPTLSPPCVGAELAPPERSCMNLGRLVGAAIAATVTDAVYGFLVYGMLLAGEFGRYPSVYRPNDAPPTYLATMFLGILVAMFAVTYIYAKGYEGGSSVAEGARFGLLFG